MDFTPILSAVVTVARALVILRAWTQRQDCIQQQLEDGYDERAAREKAPSMFEMVKDMVHKFMTLVAFGGKPSPMDRILHTRTYGMKIRYNTKGRARTAWVEDRITIDKISFTMDDIRTVVHGLNKSVREILMDELLLLPSDGSPALPELDLAALYDNEAEMGEGFSFLTDPRNEWDVEGPKWMWRRIWKEEGMEKKFTKGGLEHVNHRNDIQWNEQAVESYFRKDHQQEGRKF
ncbi:hypothetical protein MBLNU459_g1089t1 [Dothideomycetes sp. NU459]